MRLLFALLVAAAGVAITLFFADNPGAVSLSWQGWQVDTSVGVLALTVAALLLVGWVLLWLINAIIRTPGRFAAHRRGAYAFSGYRAVTDGLVALAAGDLAGAERLRLKAEDHFVRGNQPLPPLTRLLTAQIALLRSDTVAANREFTAMLASPETEFLGLRGLIVQALKAGDEPAALALTERANRLKPKTGWVLDTQLELQTRSGAWEAAQRTLSEARKAKTITAEIEQRHRIAVLLARSAATEDRDPSNAVKFALTAHGLDRTFAPAAVASARLLAAMGRPGRGFKIIETTWGLAPHPALVAQYDQLSRDLPVQDRLKRLEKLIARHADEAFGHLAASAVALEARLWGEARRHLDAAGARSAGPWSASLCRLMADLEERELEDPAAAALWRARLSQAAASPEWLCSACEMSTAEWHPACPHCSAFDTLGWATPLSVDRRRAKLPHPAVQGGTLPIPQLPSPNDSFPLAVSAPNAGIAAENAAREAGM